MISPKKNCSEPDVFRYALPGGWEILAGRTDRDNDILSLRTASPRDWWFHVKGMPGSHVILRCPEDQTPDRAILETAAAVAAYHSKARKAGKVAVIMARTADVSKPRGAKAGSVLVKRDKTLNVRPALPSPEPGNGAAFCA